MKAQRETQRGIAPGVSVRANQHVRITGHGGAFRLVYFEGSDVCVRDAAHRSLWFGIDEIEGYLSAPFKAKRRWFR